MTHAFGLYYLNNEGTTLLGVNEDGSGILHDLQTGGVASTRVVPQGDTISEPFGVSHDWNVLLYADDNNLVKAYDQSRDAYVKVRALDFSCDRQGYYQTISLSGDGTAAAYSIIERGGPPSSISDLFVRVDLRTGERKVVFACKGLQ